LLILPVLKCMLWSSGLQNEGMATPNSPCTNSFAVVVELYKNSLLK